MQLRYSNQVDRVTDWQVHLDLRCQSKDGEIGPSWDLDSRSIQTLAGAGSSDKFVFGFDWHWRGEHSVRGRGACPATRWTPAQRNLHNVVSYDILEILPLPLLIVAGSCPKKQYRKSLSKMARCLKIVITPNASITFDPAFRIEGLSHYGIYGSPISHLLQADITYEEYYVSGRRDQSFLVACREAGHRGYLCEEAS